MSVFIPRLWWIDLVGRVETMKPWHARFKCCHMRGKITEYWLTETEDIFCFLDNEGTSSNQEGMITWCWLNLFALCGDDLLILFNWVKQFNLTNCTPPQMWDYILPAVFSRRAFISTTRKNTPLRAWSGQTRHAKTVAFTSDGCFWVCPHPDDHTNHTTHSIHNETTDLSFAVGV